MVEKRAYTVAEAAEELGWPPNKVRSYLNSLELGIRETAGSRWTILPEHLEAMLVEAQRLDNIRRNKETE